jgi:hypothetical protein
VVLEAADDAEDTIIDADGNGFVITGDDVVFDGFTIDAADTAIAVNAGAGASITDCVITDATLEGIFINDVADLATTVENCVIEDCENGIVFDSGAAVDLDDVDISGNEITGCDDDGAIVIGGGIANVDISDNTITGNDVPGILFEDGGAANDNIDITGNTISENDNVGISFQETTNAPTGIAITGNTIVDNEDEGINIVAAASWDPDTSYIAFNDISGNDSDIDSAVDNVNAYFNWWGSADSDDFDIDTDDVDHEPWLMAEQASAQSGFAVGAGDGDVDNLDGRDDAEISVTGLKDDDDDGADLIIGFKYSSNPEDDISDAIAFYDLYITMCDLQDTGEINAKIKLYDSAITTASMAHYWTGDFWAECSDQEARNGVIYVDLTEDTLPSFDDLEGTPLAVTAGEVGPQLDTPVVSTPESGEKDVDLMPTFGWESVAGADGYYFQLADNANFILPMVDLTGDLGRLTTTYAASAEVLSYSDSYYWRVKAVSGTVADGDLEESDWGGGVFFTMAEPEPEPEPEPPSWLCPQCGLDFTSRSALENHVASAHPPEEPPEIIIESPDVIVPLPAEEPITPAWIYAIIGVGAVLVIAVIVLIIRTRRVA